MSEQLRRVAIALGVSLLFLSGCSSDTERSWAYKYRFTHEDATVSPRMSPYYRARDECEKERLDASRYQTALDRCVLQPAIALGWVEWETVMDVKAQESNKPPEQERLSFITQSYGDCRKVRQGVEAELRKSLATMPGVTASVVTSACKPIYIANRDDFTPLQVSDFEGTLIRGRVKK
jgi:hypothetical protein